MVNDYNDIIEQTSFLKELLEKVYNIEGMYPPKSYKNQVDRFNLKVVNVKIVGDKNPDERYIKGYYYRCKVTLKIENPFDSSTSFPPQEMMIEIPKLHNDVFYFKNKQNQIRTRIPITIMEHNPCIIYIKKLDAISFQKRSNGFLLYRLLISDGKVALKKFNNKMYNIKGDDKITFTSDYNHIINTISDLYGEDSLKLDDNIIKKLYILGHKFEYINEEFLSVLSSISKKEREEFEIKTPYDYTYKSFTDSLLDKINENLMSIRYKIMSQYKQYGKIYGTYFLKVISDLLNKSEHNVQIGDDNNPLSNLTRYNRIVFKNINDPENQSPDGRLSYNNSFLGFICPLTTPDNKNTSVHNEISRSGLLKNGKPYVKVKNIHKGNYEYIESYKFVGDYILSYEHPIQAPYHVYYRGSLIQVDDISNIIYQRCNMDEYLSMNASLIPFANHSDTQRIAGATKNIDQSIATIGSQPSIIYTGVEKMIYEASDEKIVSKFSGLVTNIYSKNGEYFIILDNDINKAIKYTNERISSNKTYNQLVPLVKVGDYVEEGSVIVCSNSFKKGEFATGLNLKTVFTEYMSLNYREGIVISESCAKKLGHETLKVLCFDIYDRPYSNDLEELNNLVQKQSLKFNEDFINDYYIQTEGEIKGDYLGALLYERPSRNGVEKHYELQTFKIPPYIKDGVILDCWVETTVNKKQEPPKKVDNLLTLFPKNISNNLRVVNSEDLQFRGCGNKVIARLCYKIKYICYAQPGDKVSTKYYNKGIINAVIPDNEFYKDSNGEVFDAAFGALSIPSRKTTSLPLISLLSKCCVIGFKQAEEAIKHNDYNKLCFIINTLWLTDEFDSKEKGLEHHNKYKEYGYYRLLVNAINFKYTNEKIVQIAKSLNIESDEYITLNGKKIKNKLICGYTDVYRLHFLAHDMPSSLPIFTQIDEAEDFHFGIGKRLKSDGVAIGELTVMGLLSHGAKQFYDQITNYERADNLDKINNILLSMKLEINKN